MISLRNKSASSLTRFEALNHEMSFPPTLRTSQWPDTRFFERTDEQSVAVPETFSEVKQLMLFFLRALKCQQHHSRKAGNWIGNWKMRFNFPLFISCQWATEGKWCREQKTWPCFATRRQVVGPLVSVLRYCPGMTPKQERAALVVGKWTNWPGTEWLAPSTATLNAEWEKEAEKCDSNKEGWHHQSSGWLLPERPSEGSY